MDALDYLGGGRRQEDAIVDVTALTVADLQRLPEGRPAEHEPLKVIRHKHHALARALASGLSQQEAAIVSGFAPVTVSVLRTDPTFQELVRFYEIETNRAFNETQAKLAGVSMLALEELEKRLDPDVGQPEKIGLSALKDIVQMGADRTGNGPQTTQTVNVNIGLADRMAAAQKRLEAVRGQDGAFEVGR